MAISAPSITTAFMTPTATSPALAALMKSVISCSPLVVDRRPILTRSDRRVAACAGPARIYHHGRISHHGRIYHHGRSGPPRARRWRRRPARSDHRAPERSTHKTPFTNRRLSASVRPGSPILGCKGLFIEIPATGVDQRAGRGIIDIGDRLTTRIDDPTCIHHQPSRLAGEYLRDRDSPESTFNKPITVANSVSRASGEDREAIEEHCQLGSRRAGQSSLDRGN